MSKLWKGGRRKKSTSSLKDSLYQDVAENDYGPVNSFLKIIPTLFLFYIWITSAITLYIIEIGQSSFFSGEALKEYENSL